MNNRLNKLTCCRKNNIIFAILWLALLSVGISSCVDDYLDRYQFGYDDDPSLIAEEIAMPFSLTVVPMVADNPESRAGETYFDATSDEKKVADFWIIEYNEVGTRVGKPRYYKIYETYNSNKAPTGITDREWTEDTLKCEVSTESINLLVPRNDQEEFTCVVIANTHDENLFNANNRSKFSTLDSLRNFDFDIHNQQDFFYPVRDDVQQPEKYLLMSGWTKISRDPETWNPSVDLIRNACKIHVKLENFTDDLIFKYWQWRNVPYGKLFPHGTNVHYRQKISRDWIQHSEKAHKDEIPTVDNDALEQLKKGYDFWIPCNVWLPEENYYQPDANSSNLASAGENPTDQEEYVREEDPTYFAIGCRGSKPNGPIGDNTLYEFKLYPSFDPEKYEETGKFDQFNFSPNHYYSLKVDVQKLPMGHPLFREVDYNVLPSSNCYMVPRDTKDPYRVYIDRINYFWDEINSLYGLNGDEEGTMPLIYDDTEWVAEVIWQDTPLRILDFAVLNDEDAEDARDMFEGVGNTSFAFRTTGTGEGNVIIGVRKKFPKDQIPAPDKRDYWWSWHIWITDYDPGLDYIETSKVVVPEGVWPDNKKSYNVPGGMVQRFYKNEKPGDDDFPEAYLMDRNLGAISGTPGPYAEVFDANGNPNPFVTRAELLKRLPTFGMYYQYGRKDPFPLANPEAQPIYDINGKVIDEFMHCPTKLTGSHESNPVVNMIVVPPQEDGVGSLSKAVMWPYKFYTRLYKEPGNIDPLETVWWADDGIFSDSTEGWLTDNYTCDDGRSLFDPCPPGWTVGDGANFGRFYTEYGETIQNDPWIRTDPTASVEAKRFIGISLIDSEVVLNTHDPGFDLGHPETFVFDESYVMDKTLAIWLPAMGTRFGDQGACEAFEHYPDKKEKDDFECGLWTGNGKGIKYTQHDMGIPEINLSESFCSGMGVRCQRMR